MDINIYITNLKIFEEDNNEEGKYVLFCQMMNDLSKLKAEEFTQDHLDFAHNGELFFAALDDYIKAKAIRDAISYVEKVQKARKMIEEEIEKLRQINKDYGKEDDK